MGLAGIDRLVAGLLAHGAPSERPAAVVQQGTTAAQRVVAGRLDALPGLVRDAGLRAPTLIVVGEVVRLRERLDWFDPAAENAAAGWSMAQG
ncbi:Siroheme synthase [wastewater metagenome]|uniref:Siroheme synthase n=3 Tax=root TaxID=1 RepID=A0A5B8RLC7_9ZZZZ|nr:siroheme synthase [uncultured organism]